MHWRHLSSFHLSKPSLPFGNVETACPYQSIIQYSTTSSFPSSSCILSLPHQLALLIIIIIITIIIIIIISCPIHHLKPSFIHTLHITAARNLHLAGADCNCNPN